VLKSPALYNFVGQAARTALRWSPRALVYQPLNSWGKSRELPAVPKESFRQWHARERGAKGTGDE
jgi:L-lactate dehydrogenase complex protein LldF